MGFTSISQVEKWSTQPYSLSERFDIWQAKLNDSHLRWSLRKKPVNGFFGKLEIGSFGGLNIVRCICEPCSGYRNSFEISADNAAYYGLLLIISGYERVHSRGHEYLLKPGSFYLWDSTEATDFVLNSTIHKVTIFVPKDRMLSALPHVDNFVGKALDWHQGLGAATTSLISALGSNTAYLNSMQKNMAAETTISMIAACLWDKQPRVETKPKKCLLANIKDYIETNLDDANLNPPELAKRFSISTRYLHLLFKEENFSVSRWIMERRLERCRRELVHSGNQKSITEIAFRWGFNDCAHFSRSFKNRFGLPPSEYREQHLHQ